MIGQVTISVNGTATTVDEGTTVAAAIALTGESSFRHTVLHQRRGPVCGMGICAECRVTIDGEPHQRSCLIRCVEGMEVMTDA